MTSDRDGAAFSALLSTLILITIAAANWHERRHHEQQVAAARQALSHLENAYGHISRPHLAASMAHAPVPTELSPYEAMLRATLPAHADRILADPAWPALAAALSHTERAGHDPPPPSLPQQPNANSTQPTPPLTSSSGALRASGRRRTPARNAGLPLAPLQTSTRRPRSR
ncbi:hypothetical protein [Streptomyces sp. YIM 98790]|uniref:hypothetical protein n=1 Tax=Streptomyces sp. YIM 98790 TaxID=2689077 RepID=UPI00140BA020|nr:hypothetical protein [Streptomyces sp. YIM 98790]